MKIVNVLCAGILGFMMAGCGASPEKLCNDAITNSCAKLIECKFSTMSQADCEANAKKSTDCTKADTSCPSGKTYSSSNASACVNDFKNVSCADLMAGKIPSSCSTVCQ